MTAKWVFGSGRPLALILDFSDCQSIKCVIIKECVYRITCFGKRLAPKPDTDWLNARPIERHHREAHCLPLLQQLSVGLYSPQMTFARTAWGLVGNRFHVLQFIMSSAKCVTCSTRQCHLSIIDAIMPCLQFVAPLLFIHNSTPVPHL